MELAGNMISSRRGTVMLGAGAALLAALLLIVYLNRYRNSVQESSAPASVLVADHLIQKGAPGNAIAGGHAYRPSTVPKSELVNGAITDVSSLRGMVATRDIYPGQQLTASDFTVAGGNALQTNLTGSQRAIALPIDTAHGMLGQIESGDHVDVYVGLNVQGAGGSQAVLKLLMQNALVLRTPSDGAASGNVVLRATGEQTAAMAFAADNGKLWLVLRPASGARPQRPGLVNVQRLLLGVRPVS